MGKDIAVLILAHILGSSIIESGRIFRNKEKLYVIFLRGAVYTGVVCAVYHVWDCLKFPIAVFVVQILIDIVRRQVKSVRVRVFVADQIVRILSLLAIWWQVFASRYMSSAGLGYAMVIVFAGFVATTSGVGIVVGKVTDEIKNENSKLDVNGLKNGGACIGYLERALIFLLILIHQPGGIGFLVAAKSIIRFEDTKERKVAEYVLIGTLLSFSLAICTAMLTLWALGLS